MKKIKLLIFILPFLVQFTDVSSQVNFSGTLGTPTLFGGEIGYTINKTMHVGVALWPKRGIRYEPGFYGGVFRKTFVEQPLFEMGNYSLAFRPLVFAMAGLITSVEGQFYDANFVLRNETIFPAQLGGCVGGGLELVWGNGRMVHPFEIGVGKMPSIYSNYNNFNFFTDYPKFTSAFYLNFGFRFYLGNRN
ncbi:MAG: hypothetical protein ACO239_06390 [Sediminibacterium sp.]